MKTKISKSKLIIGPMFAGKSTKLIKIIKWFKKRNKKFLVFKPIIDNRKNEKLIVCHNNLNYPVVTISNSNEILNIVKNAKKTSAIFFSEVQFFDDNFIENIKKIKDKKLWFYFSGLSFDYQGKVFKIICELKKIVNKIEYRYAGCYKCFGKASFSKRIVKEKNVILIGGKEFYVPTCEKCYKL